MQSAIKQVPGTTQVEVDPVTGTLKRDGVESKLNPYDLYALETALRLKEQLGAEVTALSMGPPQAEEILREAYMMGVDDAVLVSDRKFAGADVLATDYAISQALRAAGRSTSSSAAARPLTGTPRRWGRSWRNSSEYPMWRM